MATPDETTSISNSSPRESAEGTAREFQEETRAHRLAKLEALRARGVEPYPVRFDRDSTAAAIRAEFGEIAPGTYTGKLVHIAGRVMGERRHGGLDFADLQDETGTIQLIVTRGEVGGEGLHDFSDLDLGDWVGVEGRLFRTKTNELTIWATRLHFRQGKL